MTKITLDEAKRRREAQRLAEQRARQPTMLMSIKGDGGVRKIAYKLLHELGEIERQDQLVHGLIGSNQCGVFYGESGSGKSFLAFDMAMHFALRRQWLGHRVSGGAVLYIAAEGRGGWRNRVEAFCRHHGLDDEARTMVPFAFVLETVNLGRNGGSDVAAILRVVDDVAKRLQDPVRLIITDTVARAMPGSNENDPVDMGAFIANTDAIREATGATHIGIHHSGKNTALGARGHSSLRAALDFEIETAKVGSVHTLKMRKSRDGTDDLEQQFSLLSVEIGRNDEGEAMTSCVVQGAQADGVPPSRRRPTRAQRLLTTVMEQSLDRFGIELQLSDGRPLVKAVSLENVKNAYVRRRTDIDPASVDRIVRREIASALKAEFILSENVGGMAYLFWPSKQ